MEHSLLQFEKLRLIDHSDPDEAEILNSFAADDTLCLAASESDESAMRFWVHRPTVVLGIPDSRLPFIVKGLSYLVDHSYDTIIRNSGGLAVVLDEGILNVSLVFPDYKKYDIHDGYEAMVEFIQWLFKEYKSSIEAYEIETSYCPGTYDLSIGGKKFAGISQRRVKNASAVQVYLCVEGDGAERARLLKEFYERSIKGESTKFTYPEVDPDVMQSLEQLLQTPLTVEQVMKMITDKLTEHGVQVDHRPFNHQELEWFESRQKLMEDRNNKIKSSTDDTKRS
ncbi:octanoyltransferase [Halalkalibacillus sediminis]|uniref:Octanoyl-[GcvH]:protein N-octanoyltransferase n=1 Tax=Halalkalibacillus sediminis TaxID=2018042 RepID=A0A2I0QS58_9BACI|nr:lipoate--protein ligase family protein [Halalkalibacillus sediminis]PKR77166.1 octanoyltransferase [Halalkalibacillus sediminis]